MLKTELQSHPIAYMVLMLGIVFFVWSFFAVWPDRSWERIVIGGFAIFYFLWGVLTHRTKNQTTSRLVIEYAFVSILGALLLLMLTF